MEITYVDVFLLGMEQHHAFEKAGREGHCENADGYDSGDEDFELNEMNISAIHLRSYESDDGSQYTALSELLGKAKEYFHAQII